MPTKKFYSDEIKNRYKAVVENAFSAQGLEVLTVGSAEFAIPVLDSEQNESWLVVTLKVPNGTRDGEPYDGYEIAQDYAMKQKVKAEKAEDAAKKKAAKIERDAKLREEKKRLKEQKKAEKGA